MSGIAQVRTRLAKLWSRSQPVGLILLYHRVADLEADPQLLAVGVQRFADQVAHLAQQYEVVTLHELIRRRSTHSDAKRPLVAVTFDDGYADNLANAKPALESAHVPATVFVASGYMGGAQQFWWDELESILLRPSSLPEILRLSVGGQTREWALGQDAVYDDAQCIATRGWDVLCREDPSRRHQLYRELCAVLRPMAEADRERTLCTIRSWAGHQSSTASSHRILTQQEVRTLASGPWVDVGAHTESHPVLARLPLGAQREQIGRCKERLQTVLSHPVTSFAYPYGTRADYTSDTIALVKEQGYSLACSNYPERVTRDTDVYQLPRFVVRNWDKNKFHTMLESWWQGRTGEEGHAH